MDEFEKLMAMITGQAEDALEELGKRADLTNPRDAEHIKDIMKIMFYADKLMGGEDGYSGNGDYSGDGSWNAQGDYSRTGGNQGGNNMGGGTYSNARRGEHWVRGHYSRRRDSSGRYSRMSMEEHMDAMEREAATPEEREKIKKMRQIMR